MRVRVLSTLKCSPESQLTLLWGISVVFKVFSNKRYYGVGIQVAGQLFDKKVGHVPAHCRVN